MDQAHGNHNINQIVEENNPIVPDKFQEKADQALYNLPQKMMEKSTTTMNYI